MNFSPTGLIPNRAQTLEILRLMGRHRPLLMLLGDDDGYGTRWLLDGQEVPPGIAKYLMQAGLVADAGATELRSQDAVQHEAEQRQQDDGGQHG